jgi:hypothetical protein
MKATTRRDRLFFATLLLMTWATSANAYIDAGSGSYLMQMAIAGCVGGLFTMKSYWGQIKLFLTARLRPAVLRPVAEPASKSRSAR